VTWADKPSGSGTTFYLSSKKVKGKPILLQSSMNPGPGVN